jgi:hypothetical protein
MMRLGRLCSMFILVLALGVIGGCSPEAAVAPETPIPSFFGKDPNGCGAWSCSMNQCGYNTATDPRGACCLAPAEPGEGSWSKPTCDSGSTETGSGTSCWQGSGCSGPCVEPSGSCTLGGNWYRCGAISIVAC